MLSLCTARALCQQELLHTQTASLIHLQLLQRTQQQDQQLNHRKVYPQACYIMRIIDVYTSIEMVLGQRSAVGIIMDKMHIYAKN